MGGGDETLSARERAVLAQLEARAAADDPRLADHLRGGDRRRRSPGRRELAVAAALAARCWHRLRPAVWGPVLLVGGLGLIALGLASTLLVGVAGVAVATAGISLLVEVGAARARRWRSRPPVTRQPLDD